MGKWDSEHLLSEYSCNLSEKDSTAGQDWGPNLAREQLSSTPHLLPDFFLFINGFGMVNTVRKAKKIKLQRKTIPPIMSDM